MLAVAIVGAGFLVGCGGSDPDPVMELRLQADAAESRALALAPAFVCKAAPDCALIYFEDAFPSCTQHRAVPILAAAPTRHQAEMAAETQRALAREARFAPGVHWDFVCTTAVLPLPVPYCEKSQCKARPGESETITLPDQ
jgi:hypothetical protein